MGSGFPPYVAFFLCRHSFNVLCYFPVNYKCSVWTWEICWKIWQQIWLLQGLRLWLSMNAAGQLQKSAAELKRDIRTTTMGGVLRILLCQYLFSARRAAQDRVYIVVSQVWGQCILMVRASLGKVVHTVKRAGTYAAKVPPQELQKIAVHVRAVPHPPPPLPPHPPIPPPHHPNICNKEKSWVESTVLDYFRFKKKALRDLFLISPWKTLFGANSS